MARFFRLWEKKRGARHTGSRLLGGLGEVLFFAGLFLTGAVLLTIQTSAVLRSVNPEASGVSFWLKIVAEGALVTIGAGGVLYTVFHVGASVERRSALAARLGEAAATNTTFPTIPDVTKFNDSPGIKLAYRLPVVQLTVWNFTASTVFCLLWNGITAVLVVLAVNSLRAWRPDWVLLGSLVPMLGIGGWSLRHFARQFILHTGIGPTGVELSDHPLVPGRSYQLFVTQAGRLSLRSLRILLVCEEEATYRQGTDVRTESKIVREIPVVSRERFKIEPGAPFEYSGELQIPLDGMHSFQSSHNSVHWKLVVQGQAESWPQYERYFPLIVVPLPAPSPAQST